MSCQLLCGCGPQQLLCYDLVICSYKAVRTPALAPLCEISLADACAEMAGCSEGISNRVDVSRCCFVAEAIRPSGGALGMQSLRSH